MFIRILCVSLLLLVTACTTETHKTDTSLKINNTSKPAMKTLDLNLAKISVEGISFLNTFCEEDVILSPKDALLKWLKGSIKATGQEGSLSITINTAVLQKISENADQDKYKASYDVIFKASKGEDKNRATAELKVVAENYRLISSKAPLKEKKLILHAQVEELIKLLEDEVVEKSAIYFADYLTNQRSKKNANRK